MMADTVLTGEGRVYPHIWDGSEYVPQTGTADGQLSTVAYGETSGGVKRPLEVDTLGALQVDAWGQDATATKRRLRTNANGELIVSTTGGGDQVVIAGNDGTSDLKLLTDSAGKLKAETTFPRSYIDGFGRIRVSNISTVFDSKQTSDNQSLFWETVTVGTGAAVYNSAIAGTVLSTSANGDAVLRQTYRRFNYQPGKAQRIMQTGVFRNPGTYDAGRSSRIGQFDVNNGLFFEYNTADAFRVCIRKNGSDTYTNQSAWNLDTLDGAGPSGITLDPATSQICVIDYEWLGVGSVWFGFVINGELYYCHRADNANVNSEVYMQTPNLPLSYQIVATTAGSGSMTHICSSVNSEGGQEPTGKVLATGRPDVVQVLTAGVIEKVVLALRYKDIIASQVEIDTKQISVYCTSSTNDPFVYAVRLIRDPTNLISDLGVSPPPYYADGANWVAQTGSALEVLRPPDTTGNEVFVIKETPEFDGTSGIVLYVGFGAGRNTPAVSQLNNTLKLGMSVAGVSDVLVISCRSLSSNLDVCASVVWSEL